MVLVKDLLEKGRQILEEESDKRRSQPVPTYHVSSGGLFLEKEQTTTGNCHRTALIKMAEIKQQFTRYKKIMFEGGKANEEAWMSVLKKSWEGKIKREEEIPVKSTTVNGTPIVGNPDIVLCDATDKPILGLELKCASSYYTVKNVYFERQPSLVHLVQALHYSTVLNVPFELWYTSRVDFHIPYMDIKTNTIPSSDPAYELNPKGQPKKVYSIEIGYALGKSGRMLTYADSETNKVQTSIVSVEGMTKFFDYCDFLKQEKNLGPRPINLDCNGKKMGYSKCDYCEYKEVCDKYEDSYDEWFEGVRDTNKAPF